VIEDIIAAGVLSGLANASASWSGGSARAIYDARYADPLGMSSAAPLLQGAASDFATLAIGSTVSVTPDRTATAVSFTVREAQPDGRGWVSLVLEIV
jgi:hypothetical protein